MYQGKKLYRGKYTEILNDMLKNLQITQELKHSAVQFCLNSSAVSDICLKRRFLSIQYLFRQYCLFNNLIKFKHAIIKARPYFLMKIM